MSLVAPHGEHDWLSAEYVDEWVRNDVTRDAERQPKLRRAAALLPFNRDCAIEVVDIGGGYGEFTRQVLEEFPNSSVVLHDFSEPMIVVARERLAAYGARVDYRLADLREPGWSRGLGGPFDAAVSSIAIHNLRRPAAIHAVYREVAAVVRPGGAFFNLDYVFPCSPRLSDIYGRQSNSHVRGSDGHEKHDGHHGDEGHDQIESDDEPATLENQLRWLAEGFAEVDCLWKDLREALLCGIRAAD